MKLTKIILNAGGLGASHKSMDEGTICGKRHNMTYQDFGKEMEVSRLAEIGRSGLDQAKENNTVRDITSATKHHIRNKSNGHVIAFFVALS